MSRRTPAVFMRGGTSKGLFFHASDLPPEGPARDALLCAALGSPDPNGRQLDGMGGGLSSLSKAVIVSRSKRPDCDIDYLFAQVAVREAQVDYAANCGNLTSAVGPFAIDEGLVAAADGEVTVRLFNRNTEKRIDARFTVRDGETVEAGDQLLPGVSGTAAAIRLAFLDPAGALTGALLPSGRARDLLRSDGGEAIEASLVDAAAACVFVRAADLGLAGTELPDALEADAALLDRLEAIRRAGARAMGLPDGVASAPKIGLVAPPRAAVCLDGTTLPATAMGLSVRMISMGQPHRAVPLTAGLCLAAAAAQADSLVAEAAAPGEGDLVLAHPSGLLSVRARRGAATGALEALEVVRTARRLMEGRVRTL